MPYDLILDGNDDILIEDGDFVIDESTLQHQRLLLLCNKGEFKEFPSRCVGLNNYLETHRTEALAREIDVDFSKDGMKVSKIRIDVPNLEIEADYE
ncbi:MAG: hypothetical protein ACK5KN_16625 [Dysgonomonas sp.]|uniref:hypothetical protein n=1 Tax=Dysgonomonas sp. TaxID=1891233 RepID=UPI003A843243